MAASTAAWVLVLVAVAVLLPTSRAMEEGYNLDDKCFCDIPADFESRIGKVGDRIFDNYKISEKTDDRSCLAIRNGIDLAHMEKPELRDLLELPPPVPAKLEGAAFEALKATLLKADQPESVLRFVTDAAPFLRWRFLANSALCAPNSASCDDRNLESFVGVTPPQDRPVYLIFKSNPAVRVLADDFALADMPALRAAFFELSEDQFLGPRGCGVSPFVAAAITKQVLTGLEFLHSRGLYAVSLDLNDVLVDPASKDPMLQFRLRLRFPASAEEGPGTPKASSSRQQRVAADDGANVLNLSNLQGRLLRSDSLSSSDTDESDLGSLLDPLQQGVAEDDDEEGEDDDDDDVAGVQAVDADSDVCHCSTAEYAIEPPTKILQSLSVKCLRRCITCCPIDTIKPPASDTSAAMRQHDLKQAAAILYVLLTRADLSETRTGLISLRDPKVSAAVKRCCQGAASAMCEDGGLAHALDLLARGLPALSALGSLLEAEAKNL